MGFDDIEKDDKIEKNENENIILDERSMNYLAKKILNKNNNIINDNSLILSLTFSDISRLCYSIKILLKKYSEEFKDINKEHLIDFIYDLLFCEKDIIIKDDQIKSVLLQLLKKKIKEHSKEEAEKQINNFIFDQNESLENYLSIVYASFLINLHLCIIGPPGVGKTTSAKFISEILQTENENYKFFPFHRNTKITELYGTLNIKEQKMDHYNGPLIESAQKGFIFIADEMNLSSITTMKSIVPFLDPLLSKNLLVPGLEKPFDINENFFFIACQNDLDNLGRNCVPDILQRKLRNINYPKQTEEEIKNICKKKRIKNFGKGNKFSEKDSELLGEFMVKYNETIDNYNLPLLKWSFRDIDKIIRRISEHISDDENYKNFEYFHFIYFYLLSPIPYDYFDKTFKSQKLINIINSLFINVFNKKNISDELLKIYCDNPKADLENDYIMKGNLGIKFNNLTRMINENQMFDEELNLSFYYDDLFKLKLISSEEPILLMGPSSYKTYLAKYFINEINKKNFSIINLNQKTTIEELLGGPQALPANFYMFFYDLLKDIINYKEDNSNTINEEIENMKNAIDQKRGNKKLFDILNNLYFHLKNSINKNIDLIRNECEQENISKRKTNSLPQLEFKPGSVLLSILKEESLIFKNVQEVSTEIFERFNELFGSERVLSLNEDIYGTLFPSKKDKIIDRAINLKFMDKIYIFATCPENSFQSLSESITSRFSVICVREHGKEERKKIIRNYYKNNCTILPDLYLNKILEQINNVDKINKLKNLIDIFQEMNYNQDNLDIINNKNQILSNLNYSISNILLDNDNLKLYDFKEYKLSPLYYDNNFLISRISNLRIYSQNINKIEFENIAFTPIFNKIIDLLHFGICTGTSIILEGGPGQGKQKAINYISNLLDYDVENIVITNNFSVDDLFKKTILSKKDGIIGIEQIITKLSEILSKSHSKFSEKLYKNAGTTINNLKMEQNIQKPILFVFHNIHKASADVLSKISSIFNEKNRTHNYFLIGLINIKESLIERNSL